MSCAIKICGITTSDDARMVSHCGADYLGILVNVTRSPRSVSVPVARQIIAAATIPAIVLTYDQQTEEVLEIVGALSPAGIQLAGNETKEYIANLRGCVSCELWKSLHIPAGNNSELTSDDLVETITTLHHIGIDKIVLDSSVVKDRKELKGGTGISFDWSLARAIRDRVDVFIFLAGGITPGNAADAVRQVSPGGIDLSSGVEATAGKKDPRLVKKLIETVNSLSVQEQ